MKNPTAYAENSQITVFGNTHTGHHYWIGLLSNGYDYFTGQTFRAPANGILQTIRILPELIVGNAAITITIYRLDSEKNAWLEKLSEKTLAVSPAKAGQWLSFENIDTRVFKGESYIFKLSCNNGNMMAIAECQWNASQHLEGEQWVGNSENKAGHYYQGFGLSFSVEMIPN